VGGAFSSVPGALPSPSVPFIVKLRTINGTSIQTMLGTIRLFMIAGAVICPPIHNMVGVTSPIGDQAPPALAATTISPAQNKRVSRLAPSFRLSDTITVVDVRLSRLADKIKVTQKITHQSFLELVVRMRSVTNLNPR